MKTKICRICNIKKLISEFFKFKSNKDGLFHDCKICCRNRNRKNHNKRIKTDIKYKEKMLLKSKNDYYKHRKSRIKRVKTYDLKCKYGLTPKDYLSLFNKQKGRCLICNKTNTRKHKSGKNFDLHVDHNHKTGQIRGLLCGKCNLGVGLFNENINNIKKVVAYLEKYAQED